MDKKTRAALEGSILKWRKIVKGTGVDRGGENCPLCQLFAYSGDDCGGCPVAERTGIMGCADSPYWDANEKMTYNVKDMSHSVTTLKAKAAAQKELDFLISLRPKAKRKPAAKKRAQKASVRKKRV